MSWSSSNDCRNLISEEGESGGILKGNVQSMDEIRQSSGSIQFPVAPFPGLLPADFPRRSVLQDILKRPVADGIQGGQENLLD